MKKQVINNILNELEYQKRMNSGSKYLFIGLEKAVCIVMKEAGILDLRPEYLKKPDK